MSTTKPVEVYCSVPIYLKQVDQRAFWLQWQRHEILYGVPLTNPQEAIDRARMMIDAMLALEARELRIQERSRLQFSQVESRTGALPGHPFQSAMVGLL